MSRGKRAGAVVAGLLAASYVAAGLLAPLVVDADRFRPRVEARLSGALDRPVRLGRVRLSVWTGIVVRAGRLEVGPPKGGRAAAASLEAESVSVRLAPWPLLRGRLEIRAVSVEEGVWRAGGRILVSGVRGRAKVLSEPGEAPRLRGSFRARLDALSGDPCETRFEATVRGDGLDLARLDVSSGPARLRAQGEAKGIGTERCLVALRGQATLERSRAEGSLEWRIGPRGPRVSFRVTAPMIDFDEVASFARGGAAPGSRASAGGWFPAAWAADRPSPRPVLGEIEGNGTIEAARARFRRVEATDLSAKVSLDRGAVRFEDASFGLYGGTHRGSLSIDLGAEGAPFSLEGRIEGVDAGRLLAAALPSRGGTIQGVAGITFAISGRGSSPAGSVRGTARAALRSGRLASVGILKQVAEILEMAGGRGVGQDETPFDHVSASFTVESGRASTHDLEFRSADLDLDGGGTIGLDGSLRLDVLASFSRAASADLVRNTPRLEFRVDERGRLTLPLRIRGRIEAPAVQLDLDRVIKEGLERSVRTDRTARGLLDRIFKGN